MGRIPGIHDFQNVTPKRGAISAGAFDFGGGVALAGRVPMSGAMPERASPNDGERGIWTDDVGPLLAEHLLETMLGRSGAWLD